MTLKLHSGIISRACLERIASGHLDDMQILAEFAKSRSRGQHAIEQDDDAPLAPNYLVWREVVWGLPWRNLSMEMGRWVSLGLPVHIWKREWNYWMDHNYTIFQ